jgi:SAM-dependent methyltransferase
VSDDPLLYRRAAPHYLRGRPPYSARLLAVLTAELGLDGDGVLLDVGCGPGVLAVQLAAGFRSVIGLEPDPGMLAEAAAHARRSAVEHVTWIAGRAEQIPELGLPPVRLATFGQSFHWTDRIPVAEAVYDLLKPGGSIALITHDIDARPRPRDSPAPPIPHDEVHAVVRRYLGPEYRAGHGLRPVWPERYEESLARTRFGAPRVIHAPGQEDLVRDADEVVSNFLSMSWAAPHLFGDDLDAFVADVHEVLAAASPDGRFWDWPGDTVALVATKP